MSYKKQENHHKALINLINRDLARCGSSIRVRNMDIVEVGDNDIRVVIREDRVTNYQFAVIFYYSMQKVTLYAYEVALRNKCLDTERFEYLDTHIYTSEFDTAQKVKRFLLGWCLVG
ncbi:MAG: hypothetical protein QXO37_08720 [Candidatus Nitrosocaldaceae archaeon]